MSGKSLAGRRRRSTAGFTLIELLIVIGVIALMAAILLPALWGARNWMDSFKCMNNLRQLAQAMISYSNDNGACLPGNAYDGTDHAWMRIARIDGSGGWDVDNQKIMGTLAKYVEYNKHTYMCPTFKSDEEAGGDRIICHYAVPTILSGLPVGYAAKAWCTYQGQRMDFKGIPVVVELAADSLGVYNLATQTWTTRPDGAFEHDDKIACRRHFTATNMAFHDGHAESISFSDPDPSTPAEVKAQDIYLTLTTIEGSLTAKTLHMGNNPAGQHNRFNSWRDRPGD